MKTTSVGFLCTFIVAWFAGVFIGLPLFLALLVIWKGVFGNGMEGIGWGLIIATLMGILMWPVFFWCFLVMGGTGLILYLLRRYLILKLTPVTITFFTLLSVFFWHISFAIIQSRLFFSSPLDYVLFDVLAASILDAFIACILINLCHAIFYQKKGTYQPRLWERSSRGIIHSIRRS